jgi:uncharacterized damage-inducible protein DinB
LNISQTFLPQFDHEMQITRTCLAEVPTDKMAYKPHEKSMTMGHLSSHIADMVSWTNTIIDTEEFDIAPPGGKPHEVRDAETTEELLAAFDKAVAAAHTAIAAVSDETLQGSWTFKYGGETVVSMPRIASLHAFIVSHIIHHRGQLSVYLRLNDIPVPSIYGPSADSAPASMQ